MGGTPVLEMRPAARRVQKAETKWLETLYTCGSMAWTGPSG